MVCFSAYYWLFVGSLYLHKTNFVKGGEIMTMDEARSKMGKVRGTAEHKKAVTLLKKGVRISTADIIAYQKSLDNRLAFERAKERYYAHGV